MNENNHVPVNVAVEAVYRDVLGEFSHFKNKTARVTQPHWAVPTPNLQAGVSSIPHLPLDSGVKFKICRPKPFLPPSKLNPDSFSSGDPFDDIVKDQANWDRELDLLIRAAKRGKRYSEKQTYKLHTSKVKKSESEKPIYSVNTYAYVAEHLAKDPHPFFSGKYNWLATGGCLSNCTVDGEECLLFPSGKSMNILSITGQKHGEHNSSRTQKSVQLRLTEGQRIYQIVASSVENRGLAIIRQEKVCSVIRVKGHSKKPMTARTELEIQEKDGCFVSIDINPLKSNQFCTLDSDQLLKLWDLNTSSCVASTELPALCDDPKRSSWGFTKFSKQSDDFFVLNRNTVFVKDQRIPLSQNSSQYSPKPIIDDCEDITILMMSSNSSRVYIGTTHHLLTLDLRFGWDQRWSHLLQAPPMYGSVCPRNGESELILLSSSIPDDCVAIINTWQKEQPRSETYPIGLPSIGDSLLIAQARGKCLAPSVKRRLDMATAGLTVLTSNDTKKLTSLKINSIGDIFSQEFLLESRVFDQTDGSVEEEILADLEEWQEWNKAHENTCSKDTPELQCSTIPMDKILNTIKAPLRKDENNEQAIKHWHENAFPQQPIVKMVRAFPESNLQETLCQLGKYKDLMAGVLLRAWDTEGLTRKPEPLKYVENWLESMADTNHIEDEENVGTKSNLSRPHTLMSLYNDSTTKNEDTAFKVPETPSSKRKKIKRESLGF